MTESSLQIDRIVFIAKDGLCKGVSAASSLMDLQELASEISLYRTEVSKEIEGLKGDVKEAESAFEAREESNKDLMRANYSLARNVETERDRADQWKSYHDRVAKEKHQLNQAYESNVAELKALALLTDQVQKERDGLLAAIEPLKRERDDWKQDAAASELKLKEALEERDAYKLQRDGAEIALSKILRIAVNSSNVFDASIALDSVAKLAAHPDDVVEASFDPGAPEGDKTVVSWKCTCGTSHTFEPPRSSYWSYSSECSTCAARISLSPLSV